MANRIKRCACPECATVTDACNCGSPECTMDCITTFETGCPFGGECELISYPVILPACGPSTVNAFTPCLCEAEPSVNIVTMTVRLLLTGLTIGQEYEATVNWARVDDIEGTTGSYTWTFTATATEEETGYTALPNPAGTDEPGWTLTGCSVTAV